MDAMVEPHNETLRSKRADVAVRMRHRAWVAGASICFILGKSRLDSDRSTSGSLMRVVQKWPNPQTKTCLTAKGESSS